jgi:Transposase
VLFVGNDWAEDHHDVEVVDESGRRLVRRRFSEGIVGMSELHAVIADHLGEDAEVSDVVVGIETDRGPWVAALAAAGYQGSYSRVQVRGRSWSSVAVDVATDVGGEALRS